MDKKYLGLASALMLVVSMATAQQKLSDGTDGGRISANPNAILELSSTNKGLLHTRVELVRTAEAAPLTAHVAGMMVYNTSRANDVVPGIYYNDGSKWILVASGFASTITYNPTTYVIGYVDSEGNPQTINLVQAIKANETKTLLVSNGNGKYTYYNEEAINEDGTPDLTKGVVIDVQADVIENFETIISNDEVRNELFETIHNSYVGGNVYYDGTQFTYIDQAGDSHVINFEEIVKANETLTTLVDNGDGTYTYTSEDETKTTVNIPASIVNNFEEIITSGPVVVNGDTFTTIEEYIEHIANSSVSVGGSDFITVTGSGTDADPFKIEIKEGANNSMLITNATGELEWATIESIVKANETVTRIEEEDGIYTYYNEENAPYIIDIPASVVENFETIVNSGPVEINGDTFTTIEEYIEHIANASVGVDGSDFITVTGSGTTADPYVVAIKGGNANSMLVTNAAGELEWATIESIVQANETITRIEEADGIYTYYNEENTPYIIDIPASVVENFENIYNQIVNEEITVNGDLYNTFEEYLTTIITSNTNFEDNDFITVTGSGTDADPFKIEIKEGANNSMLITNATGELEWATIESIVKANETVTRIEEEDGIYTYYNEENTPFIIDIPESVIENFENIYNNIVNEEITVDGEHYNTFEEYLTTIITSNTNFEDNDFITVTGSGTDADPYKIEIKEGSNNSMLITNAAGELEWATIESIVKANETVTRIEEADGIYTYYNEENTPFIIDIPASVVENFENIYNQIVNEEITVDGEHYNTFEEYLTTIINNNTNFEDNDFITVTGSGTDADPYKIEIKEGSNNSMLITNAAGELEWATIESIVQANETVTRIEEEDGIYTYYNEENTPFEIDIPASVVENFENIYNQIVNEEITVDGNHYNTFEEYLTTIINNNTNFEDNDFITVTGSGTDADPYKIEIKEGDDNSMLITNAAGELEWATIESIVKDNETVTRIEEADGIYTYYNEKDTPFIIDIPESVIENFENIYNNIVNEEITVDGEHYNTFEEYLTTIINNNTNFEDNDFITVTGSGTDADPYKIEIKEGDDNSMLITNDAGELEWATIESIVKANETVTRIEEADGIYTYYNEENTPFEIDIPASVIENFENIYNQIVNEEITVDGTHYNTFEEYLTTIINNNTNFEDNDFIVVTGSGTDTDPFKIEIKEGDDNSMLITNDAGELEWATIESIVKANETVTRIEEADGIYTYYNEEGTPFIIDIPASVVENFENIYNQIVNEEITVDGEHYNTFEEYLTTIINNNTNFEDNDFITVTGSGTDADPYKIEIKEGSNNSMLITNAAGELEWATIESIVGANETQTILRPNDDGTYTYFNESAIDADGDPIEASGVIIDIPASVVENFETIVNSGPVEVNGDTFTTIEDYITHIANNISNIEGSDLITVTGTGTTDDPYIVEIKEGDDNSMLITNAAGELEWITIESVVQANQKTTIVEEGTGITVTSAVAGNVTTYTVSADAVDAEDITNGKALTSTDLDLSANAPTALLKEVTANIKTGAVTSDKILDGAVATVDLADKAVTASKINENVAGEGLTKNTTTGALDVDIDKVVEELAEGTLSAAAQGAITVTDGEDALFKDVTLAVKVESGVEIHDDKVKLGGDLTRETTITNNGNAMTLATGGSNLNITGLDKATVQATPNNAVITDRILSVDANDKVKALKAAMPKFFYMPSVLVPTAESHLGQAGVTFNNGTRTGTINLYTIYTAQFGSPVASTNASALPVLRIQDLDFHVTYATPGVFTITGIDAATGVMTYTVANNADITNGSFINIVFSVKED
jgi:hypothetical protein